MTRSEKMTELIHFEFDTASDRLLKEAKDIIDGIKSPSAQIQERASRLKAIGFSSTQTVKKAEQETKAQYTKVNTADFANLVNNYCINYPFQKFLTEKELEKICKKYGLIFAPVERYIKDIPDKNLKEIEETIVLRDRDKALNLYIVQASTFYTNCPTQIKKIIGEKKHKIEMAWKSIFLGHDIGEALFDQIITPKGYIGKKERYICINYKTTEIKRDGLFIAAPRSHFNLKGMKLKGISAFNLNSFIVSDPVVFRYCKGGIQVLTKWGEVKDEPLLVNEINN